MRGFNQAVVSFGKDTIAFETSSDTLTYIGDITLDPQFSSRAYKGIRLGLIDREAETVVQLKQKYSVLFGKYTYNKLLAVRTQ